MEENFNQFTALPHFLYNIVMKLVEDGSEELWKSLKYSNYDCLSKANLTLEEKVSLIWKNQENQQDYGIFLSPLVGNMVYDSKTILKLSTLDISPINHVISTVSAMIEIIVGEKVIMMEYDGAPCNRVDFIRYEILKALNGKHIDKCVGKMQFNERLSRWSNSRMTISNEKTFVGATLTLAIQMGDVDGC